MQAMSGQGGLETKFHPIGESMHAHTPCSCALLLIYQFSPFLSIIRKFLGCNHGSSDTYVVDHMHNMSNFVMVVFELNI